MKEQYFSLNQNNNLINNKYKIIKEINRGTYGNVFKSININTNTLYAIKIIRKENIFTKQSKKEIAILNEINEANINFKYPIVKIIEDFIFNNHVCIVLELLSKITLSELLKKTNYNGLELKNVKKFSKQILLALKYIHTKWIHCDLKPNNIILVNENKCKLKIVDFGISCRIDDPNKHFYIQSLFYRAPEVFLKKNYNHLIDIWSSGCIFAELYFGKPIFMSKNKKEQFNIIKNMNKLEDIIPNKNDNNYPLFIDLLKFMINLYPQKRLDSTYLLKHKFFLNNEDN
jgi:serine/threonine protein kinase